MLTLLARAEALDARLADHGAALRRGLGTMADNATAFVDGQDPTTHEEPDAAEAARYALVGRAVARRAAGDAP